jgi:hypothetical protein
VVGQDELDRNRPLHLASLMLDAAIWKKEPFGYRLTSVLLHALNAALLFAVIATFFSRDDSTGRDERFARPATIERARGPHAPTAIAAAFGALVFALHPLVIEAVAEPSNREDLLVLLPMLVGLLFIAAGQNCSGWALSVVLVLASFFAVLAKESGIAVPLVFALACSLSGSFRRCYPGLLGGLFAVGLFLVASYVWRPVQSGIFINGPAPLAEEWWSSLAIQARIWALQLQQIVWPSNLSAHYSPEVLGSISVPIACAILAIAGGAAFALSARSRLAVLGAAICVLALLPASNFVPQFHPIADRYLYVPLAGIGMIVAALVGWLRSQYPSGLALAGLVIACAAILSLEYGANLQRQKVWQTPAALWTDVLRQYPNLAQAHIGMANAHYRAGDYEAALISAQEAVRTSSGYWADPYAIRALCEWQTGRTKDATASFQSAQKLSRAYETEESMKAAMFLSPEQLATMREILAAQ